MMEEEEADADEVGLEVWRGKIVDQFTRLLYFHIEIVPAFSRSPCGYFAVLRA